MRDATGFFLGEEYTLNRFQSTHPMRDATSKPQHPATSHTISIHASHAGCDLLMPLIKPIPKLFQSTHPMRDATWQETCGNTLSGFQSTHPMRDATFFLFQCFFVIVISIHASHAGCDCLLSFLRVLDVQFQSTHPMRDATKYWAKNTSSSHYFNPRIPCGMRPYIFTWCLSHLYFNPRIPCGMRHWPNLPVTLDGEYFNPRIPCGMRL